MQYDIVKLIHNVILIIQNLFSKNNPGKMVETSETPI